MTTSPHLLAALFCLTSWLTLSAQPQAQLLEQTQTQSAQTSYNADQSLIVGGSNSAVRARILGIAESARESFYDLIDQPTSQQQLAIAINIYGKEGDKPPNRLIQKSFAIVEGKITLKLNIHLARGVNEEKVRQSVLELLIYERALKNVDASANSSLQYEVRPWLLSGIREAIAWQENRNDRELYAQLFDQKSIYTVDELLNTQKVDTDLVTLDIAFQVSSGAMVMALLKQPQGKQGLSALTEDAATYEGEQKLLVTKHFPDSTLSKNSLSKWWALQLAAMSQSPAELLYGITETERELQRKLIVRITDINAETYELGPASYSRIDEFPPLFRGMALSKTYNDLAMLQTKAFPSYRPIIQGYLDILAQFMQLENKKGPFSFLSRRSKKKIDVPVALQALSEERQIMAKLGERMTDYLNWYQLEQPESQAENFKAYMELRQQIADNPIQRDKSPVSEYLDDIQALYDPEE